jgi:hypothetical protein
MAAILLRAIRNELPTAGNAFWTVPETEDKEIKALQ